MGSSTPRTSWDNVDSSSSLGGIGTTATASKSRPTASFTTQCRRDLRHPPQAKFHPRCGCLVHQRRTLPQFCHRFGHIGGRELGARCCVALDGKPAPCQSWHRRDLFFFFGKFVAGAAGLSPGLAHRHCQPVDDLLIWLALARRCSAGSFLAPEVQNIHTLHHQDCALFFNELTFERGLGLRSSCTTVSGSSVTRDRVNCPEVDRRSQRCQ